MSINSLFEIVLVFSTIVILVSYHIHLYLKVRHDPLMTAIGITNHARRMWVNGIMKEKRDILAIQTLRNQLMAATFLASTAFLICIGSLNAAFRPGVFIEVSNAFNLLGTKTEALWMLKLMLLGIVFFITFFNFTLCIRYYNHVGFMINTFQQDDPSVSEEAVTHVLNHGALHYTIGMRGFYLSVSLALWLFGSIWMLAGSLVLVAVLYRLDREA
ncbi:conserved hypothetical protein [Desulforapulum autotrophicum HRM2]|uniref:DUF599 domain-containing protein n=1 Tax=Desulforapulum autotrophicum (strain ATCC 43914 / DSM 3382 / VKM B-1955 / HRM2) TaxID=177437 RepID=C0QBG4_DESAH|nr:DUF599 domain-containing protein [Desulforapulum autotrophicum]ACN16966.1 conserved hypothetical protein [Desulforapulum autotrophicum HRM2]